MRHPSSCRAPAPQHQRSIACSNWSLIVLISTALLAVFGSGYVFGRVVAYTERSKPRVTITHSSARSLQRTGQHALEHLPGQRNEIRNISMHTVIITSCDRWQDWASVGVYWSFLRSGQPGVFTRLMGCKSNELLHRPISWPMPTWITYGVDKVGRDVYILYNKPWVLAQWFKEARPKQEYFLVLDADMIIRRPFLPEEHHIQPGWASAQNIWYLQDLNSVIAPEILPQLSQQRRDDWHAHPGPGRMADEVAEFFFMHKDDAPRVARLYWEHVQPIRSLLIGLTDEDKARANRTTGGDWVAETHAYPVAAAAAQVWHHGSNSSIYHVEHPIWDAVPHATHYCWPASVPSLGWSWYKHQQDSFDFTKCPPWGWGFGLSNGGLFAHPPWPSQLESRGSQLAQDLLNIEVVATLNQGFCHLHHLKFCPRSEQLLAECAKVDRIVAELGEGWRQVEIDLDGDMECVDAVEHCDCNVTRLEYCRRSCGLCTHSSTTREAQRRL